MIYQRHIPQRELLSAQLEMLLQSGRWVTLMLHIVGALSVMLLFWHYMDARLMLGCAVAFAALLLVRYLLMSNALTGRLYQDHPWQVYWQLLIGAGLTGLVWSLAYIIASHFAPVTLQYLFLLLIVMIAAFSLGFSAAIREYYIVYLFTSLWPIAWWKLVHYWEQPYNLLLGLLLLACCSLMMWVCDQTYRTFRNMIALTWEREHIAQELGDLTGSLRVRNRELQDARQQLTDLANIDELTGLGNRRLVNSVLQDEINRAARTGSELSVILLDVDQFKAYNDSYGHTSGDEVLQKLAAIMQRASTRAGEVVARYGGEEFILILPGASRQSAMRTALRLQKLVEQEELPHRASHVAPIVTVSQGLVTLSPKGQLTLAQVIEKADAALYQAKGSGRNTIVVAEATGPDQTVL